jgi:hypothetical protein
MLNIAHAVLCSDIIIDKRTGQVSYFKAIERVYTSKLPLSISDAKIGSLWICDTPQTAAVRMNLVDPQKKSICLKQFSLDMQSSFQKVHINVEQILFSQEGMYMLLLNVKQSDIWSTLAMMPILITRAS